MRIDGRRLLTRGAFFVLCEPAARNCIDSLLPSGLLLPNFDRTAELDQIEQILVVDPNIGSNSRIKRLREPAPTRYRLRAGEFRVFYDAEEHTVLNIE